MTTQAQKDALLALAASITAGLQELPVSPDVPADVAALNAQIVSLTDQLASKTQEYLASQELLNATNLNLGSTQQQLIATTDQRNALKTAIETAYDSLSDVRLALGNAIA
jgi:chromosome segregation ATPase